MNTKRGRGNGIHKAARQRLIVAVATALLSLEPAVGAVNPGNAAQGLSDADKVCIGCHATEGSSKKLANGDTLSLAIDGAAFARSVHGPSGCANCHAKPTRQPTPATEELRQRTAIRARAIRDLPGLPWSRFRSFRTERPRGPGARGQGRRASLRRLPSAARGRAGVGGGWAERRLLGVPWRRRRGTENGCPMP